MLFIDLLNIALHLYIYSELIVFKCMNFFSHSSIFNCRRRANYYVEQLAIFLCDIIYRSVPPSACVSGGGEWRCHLPEPVAVGILAIFSKISAQNVKNFGIPVFSAADSITKDRSVRRSVGRFVGRSVTLSKNVKTVYGVLKSNLVMLVEIF